IAAAVAAVPPPERAAPEKGATRPAATKRPVGKPTKRPAKPPAPKDEKAIEPVADDQLAKPRKLSPAELKKLKGKGKGKGM
ncbi:MAG: hypothetical protein K8M05_12650, partial [Deltaproteobacteria bacterium]|nr:hypothetical protein [Kofleriaceae bacterium]